MSELGRIFYWLFAIFLIYIIIELIRKIFGGSLGFEELVTTLLVANIGYSFHMNTRITALNSKISEINSKLSGHLGWHKGEKTLLSENLSKIKNYEYSNCIQ